MAKKNKVPKLSMEERLLQTTPEESQTEAVVPLLVPAKVWVLTEKVITAAIALGQPALRELVAELGLALRIASRQRLGHDSIESFAVARLLQAPAPGFRPKPPRVDAITHIQAYKHLPHRLTTEQQAAAEDIQCIWQAYGKFMDMTGRGIGGGGSSRAVALGPVDVMGEGTWEHHQAVFGPWQTAACRTVVERRVSNGEHLTMAAVVFKILVEDVYPEELDAAFALVAGTARKALKFGLNCYRNPDALANWGKPPPPKPSAPSPQGGQDAQTPGSGIDGPPPAPKWPGGLWQPPKPTLAPGQKVKLGPRKKKN